MTSQNAKVSTDSTDSALLDLLQRDASTSVAELADTIGVSKSACWRRIQKMEKSGVIKDRVALLDQEKLNLSLTVYISVRTSQHNEQWAEQFKCTVESLPEVLEVYRMSGDLDYLIKAVVSDMPGYDRLYKKIIKADIFDVSSSFVMENIKQTTRLPLKYLG